MHYLNTNPWLLYGSKGLALRQCGAEFMTVAHYPYEKYAGLDVTLIAEKLEDYERIRSCIRELGFNLWCDYSNIDF